MRLKVDRCRAYGPVETNPIRKTPVPSLFRLRLIATLAACLALAPPAYAQFDIFHRQAPPPADIPGDAPGDPNEAASLVVRINRLEEELRQAYGRIEELQNAQRQLEAQLQKFRQDVEFRFGDRSGGAPPEFRRRRSALGPGSAGRLSKASEVGRVRPERRPERAGRAAPARDDAAERAARTRIFCACGAPAAGRRRASRTRQRTVDALPPPASGPIIVGTGVAMLDQPHEQFNAALQAFQAGQYPEAETGFKSFLAANPAHRLTPDAVFYIGETYLQRSRPREAAEQYLKVTTDYSKSSRAPESMVRLGQSLAALGNSEQACATLTEFGKRYPAASASVKKLAEHEGAKDHC